MRNKVNWAELFLSGFSSNQELIELVTGDLSEERHQHLANKSQLFITIWYVYQLFRTAIHLAGQWFHSVSKTSMFTRITIVLFVSSLCVLVTISTNNFYLNIAKFGMSLLSHSGGQEPLSINWNSIVSKTLYASMLTSFIGGLILVALSRSTPMIGTMLLSIVLVISSILIPILTAPVWPLWSFITMPLVALIFSELGGFVGLMLNALKSNKELRA